MFLSKFEHLSTEYDHGSSPVETFWRHNFCGYRVTLAVLGEEWCLRFGISCPSSKAYAWRCAGRWKCRRRRSPRKKLKAPRSRSPPLWTGNACFAFAGCLGSYLAVCWISGRGCWFSAPPDWGFPQCHTPQKYFGYSVEWVMTKLFTWKRSDIYLIEPKIIFISHLQLLQIWTKVTITCFFDHLSWNHPRIKINSLTFSQNAFLAKIAKKHVILALAQI